MGARFIQTQAVFDLGVFARWMEKVVDRGLDTQAAILPGVMPVRDWAFYPVTGPLVAKVESNNPFWKWPLW